MRLTKRLPTSAVNVVFQLPGLYATYSAGNLLLMRSLAILSASLSIIVLFIAMFLHNGMDTRRKVFRHQFILYLLLCDFLKATVLLIYPVVILIRGELYGNPYFYNSIGFFTQFATEGADIAIFFFALHFAFLVFRPDKKYLNKKTNNLEGGLYRYRHWMYVLTVVIPLILSSLVFIDYNKDNEAVIKANTEVVVHNLNYDFKTGSRTGGYKPYSVYSYLPPWPRWYTFALSWGPRYFIFVSIVVIYVAIYIRVVRESNTIKHRLKGFSAGRGAGSSSSTANTAGNDVATHITAGNTSSATRGTMTGESTTFRCEVHNVFGKFIHFLRVPNLFHGVVGFFSFSIEEDEDKDYDFCIAQEDELEQPKQRNRSRLSVFKADSLLKKSSVSSSKKKRVSSVGFFSNGKDMAVHDNLSQLKSDFNKDLYNQFKQKRIAIKRQVKSLFLYPISYLCIWLIPLAQSFVAANYEETHGPIVTLGALTSFIHPINGFVDSIVFMIREKPWRHSWSVVEREELMQTFSGPIYLNHQSLDTLATMGTIGTLKTRVNSLDVSGNALVHTNSNQKGSTATNQSGNTVVNNDSKLGNKQAMTKMNEFLDSNKKTIRYGISELSKLELLNSDMGQKGWYYKGTVKRKSCWRHKPEHYKRLLWFIYRFFSCLRHWKLDFQDNCLDSQYWNDFYQLVVEEQDQIEFPSYDCVKWYWRLYHLLPLRNGVDLDEVDFALKQKHAKPENYETMVVPGMDVFLKSNKDGKSGNKKTHEQTLGTRVDYNFDQSQDQEQENQVYDHENDYEYDLGIDRELGERNGHFFKPGYSLIAKDKRKWYEQQDELQKKHEFEMTQCRAPRSGTQHRDEDMDPRQNRPNSKDEEGHSLGKLSGEKTETDDDKSESTGSLDLMDFLKR